MGSLDIFWFDSLDLVGINVGCIMKTLQKFLLWYLVLVGLYCLVSTGHFLFFGGSPRFFYNLIVEVLIFSLGVLVLFSVGSLLWLLFFMKFPPTPYSFSKDRLYQVPTSPEGRFLCPKETRRTDGYYSPSKKCYLFRKGEKLPDHLKLIRVPENVVLQFKRNQFRELKANMRIDLTNHGYNALIDCRVWTERINYINYNCVCGRPALIVSANYPGDIDIVEGHCIDNFEDLIYGSALYNQDP